MECQSIRLQGPTSALTAQVTGAPRDLQDQTLATSAASLAAQRTLGLARYPPGSGGVPQVSLAPHTYVLASSATLAPAGEPVRGWGAAADLLRQRYGTEPGLAGSRLILPTHEAKP